MNVSSCMKQDVISIHSTATVGQAADRFVAHHVGMLPVIDDSERLVGILHLRDMLDLVMPAFVELMDDFDFVRDFGALEKQQPNKAIMEEPVTRIMEKPTSVQASCGLLRAFAIINSHGLLDLPIVDEQELLVGLASRVDIGQALLSNWHHKAARDRPT